jgi:hypothetical protein
MRVIAGGNPSNSASTLAKGRLSPNSPIASRATYSAQFRRASASPSSPAARAKSSPAWSAAILAHILAGSAPTLADRSGMSQSSSAIMARCGDHPTGGIQIGLSRNVASK